MHRSATRCATGLSVRAVILVWAVPGSPPDPVPGNESPDFVEPRDAGFREPGQVVAAMVDIGFEVARPAAQARRDLREHAPGEVLVAAEPRVPAREDRRVETLRVPVGIASQRTHVVRDADPKTSAVGRATATRFPEDQHAPEEGQLIVRQRQGPSAQALADLGERRRLEHATGTPAADQARRPGRTEGCDQRVEGLIRVDRAEDACQQLPASGDAPVRRGDHKRDASLDEDPDKGGELGIEHALRDQSGQ
jgi:hypothetical protein